MAGWCSTREMVQWTKMRSHTTECYLGSRKKKLHCTFWMLMYKSVGKTYSLFDCISMMLMLKYVIYDITWVYQLIMPVKQIFLLMHIVLRTSNAKMWRLYIVLQNAQNIFVWLYHLFHCILYCQVLVIELITFCTKLKFI